MQATLTSSKSLKRTSTTSRQGEEGTQSAHTTQKAPDDIAREQFYGAEAVQASNRGVVVFSYASAQSIKQARLEALQRKLQERLKAHNAPPVDPYQGLEIHTMGVEEVGAPTSVATAGSQLPGAGVAQYSMLVVPPHVGNLGDEKISTAKLVNKGEVHSYQRSTVTTKPKAVPVQYTLPGQLSTAPPGKDGKSSQPVTPRSQQSATTPRAEALSDAFSRSASHAAAGDVQLAAGAGKASSRCQSAHQSMKQVVLPAHPMLDTLKASIPTPFLAVLVSSSLVPAKGMGTTSQVIDAVRGTLGPSVMQPLRSHSPTAVAARMVASGDETATQDAAGNEVRMSYQGGADLRQGSDASSRAVPLVKVQVEDLIGQYKQQAAKQLLAQAGLSRAPSFRCTQKPAQPTAGSAQDLKAALHIVAMQKGGAANQTAPCSHGKKAANEAARRALESASDAALRSLMQAMNATEPDVGLGIPGFGPMDALEPEGASTAQPEVRAGDGSDISAAVDRRLARASSSASSQLTGLRAVAVPAAVTASRPAAQSVDTNKDGPSLQQHQQAAADSISTSHNSIAAAGGGVYAASTDGGQQAKQGQVRMSSSSSPVGSMPATSDTALRLSAPGSNEAPRRSSTQQTFLQPAAAATTVAAQSAAAAAQEQQSAQASAASAHGSAGALANGQQQETPPSSWSAFSQSAAAADNSTSVLARHEHNQIHLSHEPTHHPLSYHSRPATATGCIAVHEAPPGWSYRQQAQATYCTPPAGLYAWGPGGARHRPRPHTATAGCRSNCDTNVSWSHSVHSRAGPGNFSFTITGCGYQQELRRQKGEEERAHASSAGNAAAQLQPAVHTRKTTSRSRNGALAWSSLTNGALDKAFPGKPATLVTHLHPPQLPSPVLIPHPQSATPGQPPAASASTRPSSASHYQHRTPTITQLAEAELTKSRQSLQYRVLERQARQLGLDSPQELLDSNALSCGALPDTIQITPAAVTHMGLQMQATRTAGYVKNTHSSTHAKIHSCSTTPSSAKGATAAHPQPVVRSLSASEAHISLGGATGWQVASQQASSRCSTSAFITPSGRQRPQSALPLNASNTLVQRTRPPSAGSWGGAEPFLANVVANMNTRKQCESLYRSSTNALEDMPGVCMATVSGFLQPPLAAAQVTAAMM